MSAAPIAVAARTTAAAIPKAVSGPCASITTARPGAQAMPPAATADMLMLMAMLGLTGPSMLAAVIAMK